MASDDDHLARDLAVVAGHRLVDLRARGGTADELRQAGDRLSHEFLTAELARLRPDDVVLSEEGADDPARLNADRVWIIDPLDGTREFGEEGRTDWAVHVALWERAQGGLTAGAVALPAQNEVLSTVKPPPLPADPPSAPFRIVVSRSRPAPFLPRMAELAGADLDPLGSAGAKVAAVIIGIADGYVHAGGQYEWDSAAPVAVARAAGFHASRIDGSELSYNQPDLLMPDILVCPPVLAEALLDAIRIAQC
ncbi:MAG TPA: 3'(2'),5'-bisphosphate nucleotidase CysQ [Streptosporangiaceae bacterium]|nr:3'(2'),5'-bisphosphate nucleotidase CysQ [Streptosporangiaceae bacterium]